MKYQISVNGCDDSTTIEKDLSDSEYALLKEIAALIAKEATYNCMPTLSIEPAEDA
jgi:hypothetical protein